jgi:AcrR family transcriptional regulator
MGKNAKKVDKNWDKMCLVGREAAKMFDKKGYLETSLKDISEAAKLSKGGIYHYFSNKHEILYFILDNYTNLLLEGLEEDLKEIADDAAKIHFIMFRHLYTYSTKSPEAKATLIYARNLPSKYFEIIAGKQKKYAQMLTNVLSDFFKGGVQQDKLKALSFSVFGMCNSIMYWYDPKGHITLEEVSGICYDIFMKGISCFNVPKDDE